MNEKDVIGLMKWLNDIPVKELKELLKHVKFGIEMEMVVKSTKYEYMNDCDVMAYLAGKIDIPSKEECIENYEDYGIKKEDFCEEWGDIYFPTFRASGREYNSTRRYYLYPRYDYDPSWYDYIETDEYKKRFKECKKTISKEWNEAVEDTIQKMIDKYLSKGVDKELDAIIQEARKNVFENIMVSHRHYYNKNYSDDEIFEKICIHRIAKEYHEKLYEKDKKEYDRLLKEAEEECEKYIQENEDEFKDYLIEQCYDIVKESVQDEGLYNIDDIDALSSVKNTFHTTIEKYFGNKPIIYDGGCYHGTRTDYSDDYYLFRFEADGTAGSEGFEFIVPPLPYKEVISKVPKLVKEIDKAEGIHTDLRHGWHIHVSEKDYAKYDAAQKYMNKIFLQNKGKYPGFVYAVMLTHLLGDISFVDPDRMVGEYTRAFEDGLDHLFYEGIYVPILIQSPWCSSVLKHLYDVIDDYNIDIDDIDFRSTFGLELFISMENVLDNELGDFLPIQGSYFQQLVQSMLEERHEVELLLHGGHGGIENRAPGGWGIVETVKDTKEFKRLILDSLWRYYVIMNFERLTKKITPKDFYSIFVKELENLGKNFSDLLPTGYYETFFYGKYFKTPEEIPPFEMTLEKVDFKYGKGDTQIRVRVPLLNGKDVYIRL